MTGIGHQAERQRIRVAHVALQLDVGGMERLLVEFARHTPRARLDLHFVCLRSRGALADDVEACGCRVTDLGAAGGLRPGLVFRLARLFRQWQVDIVHTHNNGPFLYGAPAARLAGVPGLIHTRHDRNFSATPRATAAFRVLSRLADRVVCVSEDSAGVTARQGVARSRLCRLWNGIDLGRFAYQGPEAGGAAVLVARLSPEKDVANLIRAAALVARAWPAFRLEIAGDGPCLPELHALTAKLGLAEHVRFLGAVRDVPAVLARASLFVLPSRSEGISLTLLEAMARGLPVVTTRVGGNPEVVVDGQTGFLVPPADPAALAEKMLLLLRDPALGQRMGLAGRRRVERHFDIRVMIQRYEELYRRALRQERTFPGHTAALPVGGLAGGPRGDPALSLPAVAAAAGPE